MPTYRCFGIAVASELAFPGAWTSGHDAHGDERDPVALVNRPLGRWAGGSDGGWSGLCDGEPFAVVRDASGAHRFVHGGRPLAELSPDHSRLTGDLAAATRTTRWWRALLDSVLFTVALLRGGEALHAGAVLTADGVLAVAGASGAGKSTLLAHLVGARGYPLVADDVLFVSPAGGASSASPADERRFASPAAQPILAHPGPPLMTVPRRVTDPPGVPLADVGEERWHAVPVAAAPARLRRIVVLDRVGDGPPRAFAEPAPFVALMRHLLAFPRTPEREAARLTLASALASSVQLVRVRAPLAHPVDALAELALSKVGPG